MSLAVYSSSILLALALRYPHEGDEAFPEVNRYILLDLYFLMHNLRLADWLDQGVGKLHALDLGELIARDPGVGYSCLVIWSSHQEAEPNSLVYDVLCVPDDLGVPVNLDRDDLDWLFFRAADGRHGKKGH